MQQQSIDRPTVAYAPVELLALNGAEQGRLIQVVAFPCTLGRGEDCQVVLADPDDPPGLSREHCSLRLEGANIVVADHSTNGTRVGKTRLARGEQAILREGEDLCLGPTLRLRFAVAPTGQAQPTVQGQATPPLTSTHSAAPTSLAMSAAVSGGRPISADGTAGSPPFVAPGLHSGHAFDMAQKVRAAKSSPAVTPGQFRKALTALPTLQQAWQRVYLNRGAAGPDNISVQEFARNAMERLEVLRDLLNRGRYEPLPPRLYAAPKRNGGVRPIAILSVQDRIVQQAIHTVLMPTLEVGFPDCSFAYRPGTGTHVALRRVESLLRSGQTWVAETDIAAFFDSISHRILLEQLSAQFPDPFLLSLVARCFAVCAVTPGAGIPQGAATSPLFSNLYLADFDRFLLTEGWNPVRYGDDLLLACDARGKAQTALAGAEGFLRGRLQLSLKAEKTRITPIEQGFTFLGFAFSTSRRRPSPEAVVRLEQQLQETEPDKLAAKQRGWDNYYGKADPADDDETLARFLELFAGREDCYARQGRKDARRTFTPCAGTLTPGLIRDHLAGRESLSTYLIRQDGLVRQMVMDIDAVRPPGRPAIESQDAGMNAGPTHSAGMNQAGAGRNGVNQIEVNRIEANGIEANRQEANRTEASATGALEPERLQAAFGFARNLSRVCRNFGVPGVLTDSGQKGRHLWILFSEPVAPERARRLGRLLAKQAGFPREGVRLEILPRHSEWAGPELGDAVALPLGAHPVSGRRCVFLDAAGEAIPDDAQALASARSLSAADLEKILQKLAQNSVGAAIEKGETHAAAGDTTDEAIQALVSGCSVARAILRKAAETGHLRHTHQLILLYTAGHLGEAGARFIHQTISLCRNYDQDVCQKYIDRLDAKHPPISCRRIREWLEEEGETGWCTCSATRKSPLELVPSAETKAVREPRRLGSGGPRPVYRAGRAGKIQARGLAANEREWTQIEFRKNQFRQDYRRMDEAG